MGKKLSCILLIDDDDDDNEYHQLIIGRMNVTETIQVAEGGQQALDYLSDKSKVIPDLIFLDINMPKMNGWEFLEKYRQMEHVKNHIIIVMLTTSGNPRDIERAQKTAEVKGFKTKPLTPEMLREILDNYF